MGRADQKAHARVRTAAQQHASLAAVAAALHPLEAPPPPTGWNRAELLELIGEAPRAPAAVLMGIRDLPQPTMIFTLRHSRLRTHAGQVAFPGGRADPGDADAIATALREAREEVGLDPRDAQPLGFLDCLETVSGYCVTPVVARIAAGAQLAPHADEVESVFEVPLAFLLDQANLRERDFVSRGRHRPVFEYVGTDPLIWGVTALMLVNLMRRMELM
jgi:8-oxo-dGTP pyrophosphatase MutT (NUDIX family)